MARRTYEILGISFKTKQELKNRIREILYWYDIGETLNKVDFEFMLELVRKYHPRPSNQIFRRAS
ncbi:TPA: DCL family protein, partial [Candidatus Micrarchaeota archaeon]|nr:DCL family protein [Candidatus Micrarchaeota archaeon]